MLKRGLVISILILVTVAAALPFGESVASIGRTAVAGRTAKTTARRRTRAWWRRRRAYLRRQRAAAAERKRRRRAWALRRRRAANAAVRARRQIVAATPHRAGLPAAAATMRAVLAPAPLPSVSLSAVDSITAIAARAHVAPGLAPDPLPLYAAPKPAPAVTTQAAPAPAVTAPAATAQVSATKPAPAQTATAQTASTPAQAVSAPAAAAPAANAQKRAASALALAHAAPVPTPRPASPVTFSAPVLNPSPLAGQPTLAAAATPINSTALPRASARGFSSLPVPGSWQNVSSTLAGEFKFSLRGADGRAVGTAVWSRVAVAPSAPDRRAKTLGGVSHAALRRTVIDRMVAEGGWVVNDFEREIGGQRVYVVVAQSESEGGARRSWTYYFTEADGRVYSLSTTAAAQAAAAVAADAEQVVASALSRARAAAPAKH